MKPLGAAVDIIPGFVPLDLQTARDGDWISLKNTQGVCVVFFKGAGSDNDDPTFSFQQAMDVAGAGAKDLASIATVYEKEAVDLATLGTWTKATQAAAASYAPGDPSAQSQALYVFQIEASELDRANGFDCIRARCSDTGTNAQLGACLYLLYGLAYPSAPESLPSAIVD